MKRPRGFTLFDLLISCTISMTILFAIYSVMLKAADHYAAARSVELERQELSFAAASIRDALWNGVREPASDEEMCIVKDTTGRTASFYLKDKKIYMYKNAGFYLTTGVFSVKNMMFAYGPDVVRFELENGRAYHFHL